MVTEFDLPTFRVHADDGYDTSLGDIVDWLSRTRFASSNPIGR